MTTPTRDQQREPGMQGSHEPRFRFWGRSDPRGRSKPAILAPRAERPVDVSREDDVAVLRVYDPIDSWGDFWGISAAEFAAVLDEVGDVAEIRLHINSPGGEVFEGIAIVNQLRNHPARVVAHVDGLAASIASVLACAADETVMGRNSELMIHNAWGICIGNATDMRGVADRLEHLSRNMAGVYAAKSGTDADDWLGPMDVETWYTDAEAVTAGLADRVQTTAGDEDGADQARFDLSIFEHAGRAEAPAPPVVTVTPDGATGDEPDVVEVAPPGSPDPVPDATEPEPVEKAEQAAYDQARHRHLAALIG